MDVVVGSSTLACRCLVAAYRAVQAKMPPLLLENIFIALLLASIDPRCTYCGTVSNPLCCILLATVIVKVEFANNLKAGDCGIGIIAA